ncbi:MAG: response regulator, partial [Planctomycetales bacterium]|nr:response regulator [Planctomycetales bacterium]
MTHGRILLVDDDPHILDSMADWLREQGFVVAEASDCKSAIECLHHHEFDLMVCDIRLPDGDGFDL